MSKQYTARSLVSAMYAAKASPNLHFRTGCWPNTTLSAGEFQQWFMKCLQQKINRNSTEAGHKFNDNYTRGLELDRRTIDDYTQRRIRNTGCQGLLRTPELRLRYPHINCQRDD